MERKKYTLGKFKFEKQAKILNVIPKPHVFQMSHISEKVCAIYFIKFYLTCDF